jgi:hypothetical protein
MDANDCTVKSPFHACPAAQDEVGIPCKWKTGSKPGAESKGENFPDSSETGMFIGDFGGREGIRTPALLVANEALSQLSYSPTSSN